MRSKNREEERICWWDEVRDEIQKSTLALGCTHVLGYREMICTQKEIHVMTAIGTAVKFSNPSQVYKNSLSKSNM